MNTLTDPSVLEHSAGTLRSKFDAMRLKYAELSGIGQAMRQRQTDLTQAVALAKARVELAPDVAQLFEQMQEKAHQRSVGVFENLLTAIVQDVFPEKGAVKLTLSTERNAPALDITIQNGAVEEDIIDGNGGAITNVVVTGLRYAARSRTKTRPLMVLDESDCWIKPDRVPAFMKVVTDIATQTDTQTLLISHHDAEFFEGDISIIRLERDADGKVTATPLEPRTAQWENDEVPGLRWIELINFRAHEHTLIPLSPGVNALIGENDLGKSTAFVSALRAVAYGESDDTMLRHGATETKVRLGLEEGYVLEWTRKQKGTPKVMYALYKDGELLHEGKPETRGGVPAFVADVLRISRVDDLDIQLAGQKQPVFLLNEPPSRRAQLLSVGRESGFLHAMIDKQREWMRRDRETIRDGEAELMRLHRRLAALNDLQGMASVLDMLSQLLVDVESTEKAEKAVRLLVLKMDTYAKEVASFTARVNVLAGLPKDLPVLHSQQELRKLVERIAANAKAAEVTLDATLPEVPELQNNRPIIDIGKRLATFQKIVDAAEHLPEQAIEAPQIAAEQVVRLGKLGEMLSKLQSTVGALSKESDELQSKVEAAELDFELLKDAAGGVCPLCDKPFTTHQH